MEQVEYQPLSSHELLYTKLEEFLSTEGFSLHTRTIFRGMLDKVLRQYANGEGGASVDTIIEVFIQNIEKAWNILTRGSGNYVDRNFSQLEARENRDNSDISLNHEEFRDLKTRIDLRDTKNQNEFKLRLIQAFKLPVGKIIYTGQIKLEEETQKKIGTLLLVTWRLIIDTLKIQHIREGKTYNQLEKALREVQDMYESIEIWVNKKGQDPVIKVGEIAEEDLGIRPEAAQEVA